MLIFTCDEVVPKFLNKNCHKINYFKIFKLICELDDCCYLFTLNFRKDLILLGETEKFCYSMIKKQ